MIKVIAVTSTKEQQEVIDFLREELQSLYVADPDITIVQSDIRQIDVIHHVNNRDNLAASYRVVTVPVTISYEQLKGFPLSTSFNINRVLTRLDHLKQEVIKMVNTYDRKSTSIHQKDALEKAARNLFT